MVFFIWFDFPLYNLKSPYFSMRVFRKQVVTAFETGLIYLPESVVKLFLNYDSGSVQ